MALCCTGLNTNHLELEQEPYDYLKSISVIRFYFMRYSHGSTKGLGFRV